eukprot:5947261-Amphidinium_carterae.1
MTALPQLMDHCGCSVLAKVNKGIPPTSTIGEGSRLDVPASQLAGQIVKHDSGEQILTLALATGFIC